MMRPDGTSTDLLRPNHPRPAEPPARPSARMVPEVVEAASEPESGRWARGGRAWLVSLAILAPATIPYVVHFGMVPENLTTTGFLVWDMPYYMANAREHFDNGGFYPLYGNPSSFRYDTPRIYVQPMSLLLGAVWRVTGMDPGIILVAFGFLAAWGASRAAMLLYGQVVGLRTGSQWLGLVAFSWGGGVLVVAGLVRGLIVHHGTLAELAYADLFYYDPGEGSWFLNFGRNLTFPTEALYHGLFFAAMALVLRRRFRSALAVAAVLSASHPFTGAELLAILGAWSLAEVHYFENRDIPRSFPRALIGLGLLHIGYYLGYMRTSPEHRSLMEQWSLAWTLMISGYLPGYAIAGAFVAWRLRRARLAAAVLARPGNRLLLAWAAIAFALAKHEVLAPRPIQPIHFERGYIWSALFLLGAAPLVSLIGRLTAPGRRAWGIPIVAILMGLYLSDNAAYLAQFPVKAVRENVGAGWLLPPTFRDLYHWLDAPENRGSVILAEHDDVGYLATVYSSLRAWIAHPPNTPGVERRRVEQGAFFARGEMPDYLRTQRLLVIFVCRAEAALPSWLKDRGAELAFNNEVFRVYRIAPTLAMPDRRLRR